MRPTPEFGRAHVCLACGDDTGKCGCKTDKRCHECLELEDDCACFDGYVAWDEFEDSLCMGTEDEESRCDDEGEPPEEGSCYLPEEESCDEDTSAYLDAVCGQCGRHVSLCECEGSCFDDDHDDYACSCCNNYPCTCGDI